MGDYKKDGMIGAFVYPATIGFGTTSKYLLNCPFNIVLIPLRIFQRISAVATKQNVLYL